MTQAGPINQLSGCSENVEDGILALIDQGKLRDAANKANAVLFRDPSNANARYLLGVISHLDSCFDESNEILRGLRFTCPHDSKVHFLIAKNHLCMGRFNDAAAFSMRAIKLDPSMTAATALFEQAVAGAGGLDALTYAPPPDCQIPGLGDIYKSVFGYRMTGKFLEIGAFDGESYSNTSFLADIGWSGVYIEPVPSYAATCRYRHERNDVRVFNYAMGAADGEAVISVRGVLSSLSLAYDDAVHRVLSSHGLSQDGEPVERVTVAVRSPSTLIADIGWSAPDLMVVDVEGFEWPIISSFDFDAFRPTMIVIEVHDNEDYPLVEIRDQSRLCIERILGFSYRILWRDAGNVIFVADDDDDDRPRSSNSMLSKAAP